MPDQPVRVYWDANVFLSYVAGVPDRVPDIDGMLIEAERGMLEIITSTLSIVEVAFAEAEKVGKVLDPEVDSRIKALWAPPSPVRLVEFHPLIAEDARDLVRNGIPRGWSGLKPADAVHLATAARMDAREFHTYEKGEKLGRYCRELGIRMGPPLARQLQLPTT